MLKLLLLAATVGFLGIGNLTGTQTAQVENEALDTHIIVRLENSTAGRNTADVLLEQSVFLNRLGSLVTRSYKVTDRMTDLSNILFLDVPASKVSSIKKLPGVAHVSYNKSHAITGQSDGAVTLNLKANTKDVDSDDNVSAQTMSKPSSSLEGEGIAIAVLDTGFMLRHKAFKALECTTKYTQASLLPIITSEGFHGKPDASHSTYYNNKIPFYYDYGGTSNTLGEPGTPDYDVLPVVPSDHGTHCASIAAANGTYTGIAPNSQLILMKVFTDYIPNAADKKAGYTSYQTCYDSSILLAMEDAYKLGTDVLSLSLGSDLNDFDNDSDVMMLIKTFRKEGTFVNFAAGNSGKGNYAFTASKAYTTDIVEGGILSDYTNCSGSIDVAACQADKSFFESALLVNGTNVSYADQVTNYTTSDGEVTYNPERRLTDLIQGGVDTFDWVRVPGLGEEKDYESIDVKGKIAVIDRGQTTFTAKVSIATTKGAIAVAIINNDPTETDFTFRMDFNGYQPSIPVVTVLFRDRENLATKTTQMKVVVNQEAVNPTARKITDFSSDGATFDLQLRPDISTPGQSIKGAVIDDAGIGDEYEYFDGTSMATPNFSGAVALALSEKVGEPDYDEYRKSLLARFMSTATIMQNTANTAPTSVRRQGAGLINISKALGTKVWLQNPEEGQTTDGIDTAKIELRNNNDIKNGKVSLSFIVNNSDTGNKSYTAKTYVYAPKTITYNEENYPEFAGTKFTSIEIEEIATASEELTVAPGKHTITLKDLVLSDTVKDNLDKTFENGCCLEGFVILEEKGTATTADLNIPFLGFYGDYAKAAPVEPFNFDKIPGKVYESDLINKLCISSLNYPNTDFGSCMVSGYWPSMEDISISDVIYNETNLNIMSDANLNKVNKLGYNAHTGQIEKDVLYVGNNGVSNTIIIQQFVTRSVSTNVITFKNLSTGQTVLTDHMFDSLWGDSGEDEEGHIVREPNYALCKSMPSTSYISSGIVAHRAYTIIPLFDEDASTPKYEDGEYEMTFDYTLAGTNTHYTFTKTFNLESNGPTISSFDEISKGGVRYYRIRYAGECNMSHTSINGFIKEISQDEFGYYIDIEKSKYDGYIWCTSIDKAGCTVTSLSVADDPYHLAVTHKDINMNYTLSKKVTDNSTADKANLTFALTIRKGSSKATFSDGFTVSMKLTNGLDPDSLSIFAIASDSSETAITDFDITEYYVTFHTNSTKFRMASDKVANPPEFIVIDAPSSGGGLSTGAIIGIVAGSVVAIGVAVLLVILNKKKKLKTSKGSVK